MRLLGSLKPPIRPENVGFGAFNDLTMLPNLKPPFRRFLEKYIIVPIGAHQIRRDTGATQYSDNMVDRLASISTYLTAGLILIIPLWMLALAPNLYYKLAVTTGCLLAFLLVLGLGTRSQPFEVLAAATG
jgi:hypothetical protein